MTQATAIVVAAGEGRRIGGDTAKTYLPICGRPMVLRTLDRVFSARSISTVVLVVGANDFQRCEVMLREDPILRHRSWLLQNGGATRQDSVKQGLSKVDKESEIVVVHDGARPFASPRLIDQCVQRASQSGAVVVGLPVRDTIKVVSEDHWVRTTPVRSGLWEIQTPQAFRRVLLQEAHDRASREGFEATDDAMLVEALGEPVFVLEGERMNFKITVPEDVWLAETLIREGKLA
jgi:2-C-methyl-D-erythritol 4-phosphate cytidylyltransferase